MKTKHIEEELDCFKHMLPVYVSSANAHTPEQRAILKADGLWDNAEHAARVIVALERNLAAKDVRNAEENFRILRALDNLMHDALLKHDVSPYEGVGREV